MMMAPPHNNDPVKLYPKVAGRHAVVVTIASTS